VAMSVKERRKKKEEIKKGRGEGRNTHVAL
jgi:hypothetical protein